MKLKSSLLRRAFLFALLAPLVPSPAPAAIAPRELKELNARAGIIVTGKVIEFTGTKGPQGIVQIKLEVASVIKGDVKAGATLQIVTWSGQYVVRDEQINGSQGLDPLPAKGDTVKAWLNLSGTGTSGNTYSTLHPNGVQVVPAPKSAPAAPGKK